jgi:L-alanine-DL-glutamate epimerase-like enolase superfamily enzyme
MKITKVDVMMVKIAAMPKLRPIICRIFTDEGLFGDGEAALAYGIAAPAAFGMVQDLSKLIIGMDPLDNEVIWDKLYKSTFWGQNGGPVVFAGISAIDIALWDIKGKYFNVPVYKLLGGKRRDNLRTYASQLQFGWDDPEAPVAKTEDYAAVARKAVAEGYDCIKIDFFTFDRDGRPFATGEEMTRLLKPYYVQLIEERISAVREAIGPNVDIIMENHSTLDANSAVQLGRMAQKHNMFYFEEPNTPTAKMAKYINGKLNMPIAHGERIYSRWQYAEYFENNSVEVIQPDIGNCGGLTEAKKICDMAYTYDVNVQAHVCASPYSTAVALHLECVIPNFVIHEHHRICLLQCNKDLCVYDYQPVDGKYKVPELPGIGNEFSEVALKNCDKVTVQ